MLQWLKVSFHLCNPFIAKLNLIKYAPKITGVYLDFYKNDFYLCDTTCYILIISTKKYKLNFTPATTKFCEIKKLLRKTKIIGHLTNLEGGLLKM